MLVVAGDAAAELLLDLLLLLPQPPAASASVAASSAARFVMPVVVMPAQDSVARGSFPAATVACVRACVRAYARATSIVAILESSPRRSRQARPNRSNGPRDRRGGVRRAAARREALPHLPAGPHEDLVDAHVGRLRDRVDDGVGDVLGVERRDPGEVFRHQLEDLRAVVPW